MSHVAEMELEIKDLDALAKACKALGLELVRGQQQYKWYGRSVGDYALPAGVTASELGKCQHAIRIPGNSKAYEVGVVQRKDGKKGYTLLWDFWQGGFGMQAKVGAKGGLLAQAYATEVTVKHYQQKGFRIQREQKEDGRVLLHATR